ncbi:MAG: hypothetical protein NTV15_02810 [Candidatus Bathyarchaeota archaeon]|nr:hypothetical protein [Candidatus Bathyarchaeota archaeon]
MGVNLSLKKHLAFDDLRERSLAVNAFVVLYSFLNYIEEIHITLLNLVIKFIYKYEGLNDFPDKYLDQVPRDREAIRIYFAALEVNDLYTYPVEEFDENGLLTSLVMSEASVKTVSKPL